MFIFFRLPFADDVLLADAESLRTINQAVADGLLPALARLLLVGAKSITDWPWSVVICPAVRLLSAIVSAAEYNGTDNQTARQLTDMGVMPALVGILQNIHVYVDLLFSEFLGEILRFAQLG